MIISILGMHRSGTSCVTGMIEEQGVFLGAVNKKGKYNIKGNRENPRIVRLNEDLLRFNNAYWFSPPKEKIKYNWLYRKWQKIVLEEYKRYKFSGFKDPRTLILLDFWDDLIRPIGVFRNPVSVAESLLHRDNMPFSKGIELWKQYNKILLKRKETIGFPVISFDRKEILESQVAKALDFYGIETVRRFSFNDFALSSNDCEGWENSLDDQEAKILFLKLSEYAEKEIR